MFMQSTFFNRRLSTACNMQAKPLCALHAAGLGALDIAVQANLATSSSSVFSFSSSLDALLAAAATVAPAGIEGALAFGFGAVAIDVLLARGVIRAPVSR